MEIILLSLTVLSLFWGIYLYSEIRGLENRAERTFIEVEKDSNILKREIRGTKRWK